MRKQDCLRKKSGFTLLEVVAVVAMIGVLASFLLPSVETYINRSHDMKLTSDLSVIDSAIMLYRMDQGGYPASLKVLQPDYLQRQELTDVGRNPLVYSVDAAGKGYKLSGQNTAGATVYSKGSLQP